MHYGLKIFIREFSFISFGFIIVNCQSDQQTVEAYYEGPEALEWLQSNNNPYALASNHFESTAAAITFVKVLYAVGATEVRISRECIRDEDYTLNAEGGPYADGLVVVLPVDDPDKRDRISELCAREADPANDKPKIVDNMIFLCWD